MAAPPHVTLSGDINGEYVVEDQRPDGRLSLAPCYPRLTPTFSGRAAGKDEWRAFLAEHGPQE